LLSGPLFKAKFTPTPFLTVEKAGWGFYIPKNYNSVQLLNSKIV